jgi:hypothetical protein
MSDRPCEWGRNYRPCGRRPTKMLKITPAYGGEEVFYCEEHQRHPATVEAVRGYRDPAKWARASGGGPQTGGDR